jgi:hypothetical protein
MYFLNQKLYTLHIKWTEYLVKSANCIFEHIHIKIVM